MCQVSGERRFSGRRRRLTNQPVKHMSHDFEIKPATRGVIIPLIGLYGPSGCGKTRSGLMFARGLVGPSGRIVLICTENKRGHIFADVIPGSYRVIDLTPPFSPLRYAEAIEAAEAQADVVMVDSMSHSHDGEGGVLDMHEAELDRMAGNDWKRRDACSQAAWIKPKMQAKRLVQRIQRSGRPVICCLRAHEKTRILKKDNKTVIEKDDFTTPIMDPKFIFEMLFNLELCANQEGDGGFVYGVRKISHEDVRALLPKCGERISISHGEALARWCSGHGGTTKAEQPSDLDALKKSLWTRVTKICNTKDLTKVQQHMWDECLMPPDRSLDKLTVEEITAILAKLP